MTITLEVFAILLSIVAFIVTVLGFFASLKFYRDGVSLQQAANDALTQIAERTNSIQDQVGGMFDKTLDAALRQSRRLDSSLEDVESQLTDFKNTLLEEARGEIGKAGAEHREKTMELVEKQFSLVKEKLEHAKESADELSRSKAYSVSSNIIGKRRLNSKLKMLTTLACSQEPLSIGDLENFILALGTEASMAYINKIIEELMEEGFVAWEKSGKVKTYTITNKGRLSMLAGSQQ